MVEIPSCFDHPGAAFVTLPMGSKFPPNITGWQDPKNWRSYKRACKHGGNVGILACNSHIGLDKDNPEAFEGLELPATTTWETRPGRLGMRFKCSDDIQMLLVELGKKSNLAQLYLFKDGKQCGEVKLQRTYQVIPPSWKKLEDGTRADYMMVDSSPPAEISLAKLLADIQAIGITFSSKLEKNAAKLESKAKEARQKTVVSDEARTRRYAEAALHKEAQAVAGTSEGSRNKQLNDSAFALAQFVAAGALDEGEVILELTKAAEKTGLGSEEITKTIRSALDAGKQHPREIPPPPQEKIDPIAFVGKIGKDHDIQVDNSGLDSVTDQAICALMHYNTPPRIFSRAGSLVRLHKNESYAIEPMLPHTLINFLAKSARFYMMVGTDGEKTVYPPTELARNILAEEDWPGIPEIKTIIETPVIRPDGSILSTPGYDPATKLYLAPIVDLSGLVIPEDLTKRHAEASAKFILDEIFSDFPFENNASKTNTLAVLLSAIVRPLIDGNVPLAIIDKPQAGTGASLIADLIATITTGRSASMWGMPETEDEWRKAITSALLSGSPIIVVDNVTGRLRSASLARALTARTWRDRILGKSQMADIPQEAVWIATGNNILFGGDIARRSVWIRLDAGQARPWTRTGFKHPDILRWVSENHDTIIAHLLIMARAWVLAGSPKGSASLGGYHEWAGVISGILEFAGVKDFMGNSEQMYDEMDQDVQQWDAFLKEWQVVYQLPIKAGRLRDDLTSLDPIFYTLRDAMPDDVADAIDKGNARSLKLGHVLRKHLNQVYPSGRKLTQDIDTHNKTALWTVSICGDLRGSEKNEDGPRQRSAGIAGVRSHQADYSEESHARNARTRANVVSWEKTPASPADQHQEGDHKNSNPRKSPQNDCGSCQAVLTGKKSLITCPDCGYFKGGAQ